MLNSTEVESKLHDLTQRQCQILYWVCQGLTFKEVAAKINFGEDLVTAEMSRIYKTFGLTEQKRKDKRAALEDVICPLHLKRVSDPEVDCREHVIEVNAPPPDPAVIQEVREDARMGLIPLKGAMVHVGPPPADMHPPERGMAAGGTYSMAGRTSPPIKTKDSTTIRDILIGVLATLLVLTMCLLGGVVMGLPGRFLGGGPTATTEANGGNGQQPATTIAQGPATAVPPVVVTVLVPATAAVQATAPPVVQTVVVTQAPPTAPPATPTPALSLPFTDNFDDGIRPEWVRAGGEWTMSNGKLTNAGDMGIIWLGPADWKDVVVEADVEGWYCDLSGQGFSEILVRMQDPQNYIAIMTGACGSEGIYLVKDGNKPIKLAGKTAEGKHFRIEQKGQVIHVLLDGQLVWSASDETFGSGSVGFRANQNAFLDNLKITKLGQ